MFAFAVLHSVLQY